MLSQDQMPHGGATLAEGSGIPIIHSPRRLAQRGLTLSLLFFFLGLAGVSLAVPRRYVRVEGKRSLPLRVLVRPFSNIYEKPDTASAMVRENVDALQAFYVYKKPKRGSSDGWYEVGPDTRGTVLGWLQADDVMEWKQTMCVSYTHPAGRHPVLLFSGGKALLSLLKAPPNERAEKMRQFNLAIDRKQIPDDFPVISREPKDYIDIAEQFYLMPILESAPFEFETGDEGRILQVAAAAKNERGALTVKSAPEQSFASDAPDFVNNPETAMKSLQMDVIYVIDTTASMGPFIQVTLDTIREVSQAVASDPSVSESVKFGLWAYRDSMTIPGIEFHTKNFTPDLQRIDDFGNTLTTVRPARVGSQDYPEDVFAGIERAIRESQWTPEALHFIVLIGDAPSHELGHPWNSTGQSAETLRQFADPPDTYYIFALHLKDPQARPFWPIAEEQFRTLSRNPGSGESAYKEVDSNASRAFSEASKAIAGSLAKIIQDAKGGRLSIAQLRAKTGPPSSVSASGSTAASGSTEPSGHQPPPSSGSGGPEAESNPIQGEGQAPVAIPTGDQEVSKMVTQVGYAALLEWIGKKKGAKAPRDIVAWTTDRDPEDPTISSLDVRILITKNQLDSLVRALQEILLAAKQADIGGEDLLKALQAIPSVASRGAEIGEAKKLSESKDFFPEFIMGLPYKSLVMDIDNETWSGWGEEERGRFLENIDAKIQLYSAIYDNANGWISLNEGDDPGQFVHPLLLDALP